MTENPYAPPSFTDRMEHNVDVGSDEFATRTTRFVASIVDGLLIMGIMLPTQYLSGYMGRIGSDESNAMEELLMALLATGSMLILNGYLLATRGQTIGKLITNIQIVDSKRGHLLPFLRVYVYRNLWILPFELATIFIPGERDDVLVAFLGLLEVLWIFGHERRCLHDYIAGSKVVQFRQRVRN